MYVYIYNKNHHDLPLRQYLQYMMMVQAQQSAAAANGATANGATNSCFSSNWDPSDRGKVTGTGGFIH